MKNLRPVWAEIDLGILKRNYRCIKSYTKSEIMPIVKADAYGHGAVEVVRALKSEGVERFGVAILEEALELKQYFPELILMVIGPTLPEYSEIIVENEIIPEVFQVEQAVALSKAAVKFDKKVRLHIKVDTGMGRIGFRETVFEDIIKISQMPNVIIEGIYSHMATADSSDLNYSHIQHERFERIYAKLEKAGVHIPIRHLANSAAILRMPEIEYELCRPGIVLYGYLPMKLLGPKIGVEPVLSLKTKIAHLKTIEKGQSVGYGRSFIASFPTKVATLPIGYADGLRRDMSNGGEVLLKGKRAVIIGKVCMDQVMIDVTEIEDVSVGDEVTIIGKNGGDCITAEDMADYVGTISYEIICNISKRVPRIYVE
ncbi:MAG: alanine racemase [Eubacteriales bacterium]